MDRLETERAVLSKLYEANFLSDGWVDLSELRAKREWDEKPFQQLLDRMIYDGLIRAVGVGRTHKIQDMGVEEVEKAAFGPSELVKSNKRARALILKSLADTFEDEGPAVFVHYQDLAEKTSLNSKLVWSNLEFLSVDVEFETIDRHSFRISQFGLAKIEGYRRLSGIISDFEEISKMQPQPRGRALQKLLAKIFEQQGWSQMEGVRTSNEEIDVVVYLGREYYFVECKWERDPIQTEVVDKLVGKLVRRPDLKGVIASMSGFSKGIADAVKGHANTRVILLFGPEDLRSMIYVQRTFDQLVDEKYRALVIQQKVAWQ